MLNFITEVCFTWKILVKMWLIMVLFKECDQFNLKFEFYLPGIVLYPSNELSNSTFQNQAMQLY